MTLLAAGSSRKIVSTCSRISRNISVRAGVLFRDNRWPGFGRDRRKHILLAHDQGGGIVAGDLEAVAVRDGIGGACFHAVTAEDTAVVVDVVDRGVALSARDADQVRILRRF